MKLLAIDGNSLINRAFYGVKPLSNKDGFPTHAIYGFFNMFLKIREDIQPDVFAFAFDVKQPTFRHQLYDAYKAGRKGMPDDLAKQFPVLKELLALLGYPIVECPGYEADDILGTLAKTCEKENCLCVIATGDRDSLQLVSDSVSVRLCTTRMGKPEAVVFDTAAIREKYGVPPEALIDIKAIQGDASDNIPGVPGIGEKGALDLIQTYGNIESIYEKLDGLDLKPAMRKKLTEGKESAFTSKILGTINTDVPINTDLDTYHQTTGDPGKAKSLLIELGLFSILKRLGLEDVTPTPPVQASSGPESIQTNSALDFILNENTLVIYKGADTEIISDEDEIKKLLESDVPKRTHDVKALLHLLQQLNITPKNIIFDSMLAAYLLNPSSSDYSVSRLLAEYGGTLSQLFDKLESDLEANDLTSLYREIELPLAYTLFEMEKEGIEADAAGITAFSKMLETDIAQLQIEIYAAAGTEFNINSPKQLGEILFDKIGLKGGKRTKTGFSTNVDVLEQLTNVHPVPGLVLKYRTLQKLKSTYCDGLLKVIGSDSRIHTTFIQTEARTGRISSVEPNLQNIPVRTELGRELRRFFRAKEGYVFIDADYSQVELRILAHISGDETMLQAFRENQDIHATTAAQVFDLPPDFITPIMRSRAKAVNFGIVYGISAFSLSKDIGVTRAEADSYIKNYMHHYPGVAKYMEQVVADAKESGYVQTIFGRRRYLPELRTGNFATRSFGERVARNMPIQGTAADIIKIAMNRISQRLSAEDLASKLILQVHDELIVEAPEEEAERVATMLREEMEGAVKLAVPLTADTHIGKTWYDAKG